MQYPSRVASTPAVLAALLAGAALLLGGGGTPAPVSELLLQCFAVLVVAALVLLSPRGFPYIRVDRRAWLIALLVLAVPAIQLAPLPAGLWHRLPGREVEMQALRLVGLEDSWQPWSMAPRRTLAALLVLVPAVAMLLQAASLNRGGRALVVAIIAAIGGLSLIVGAGQLAAGEGNAFRFYEGDLRFIDGFQANHNSAADVLLIALVAVAAALREYVELNPKTRLAIPHRLVIVAGSSALLGMGVVLTASRAGMLLLPVALAGVVAIAWPWLIAWLRPLLRIALAATAVSVIAVVALARTHAAERVMSRFAFAGEPRPALWNDALFAAWQHFPWGAGVGAFVPVYLAVERLDLVDTAVPNRAHNDYLELFIEGGLIGVLALLAIAAVLALLIRAGVRRPAGGSRGQFVFAVTALALIALHSIVDYPLRSMSLAFVAAICAGLLMPVRGAGKPEGQHA